MKAALGSAPSYKRVARAVGGRFASDIEEQVHSNFRGLGGSSKRWAVRDWRAMATAITWAEDWLEMHRPRADRSVLRRVRRELEDAAG